MQITSTIEELSLKEKDVWKNVEKYTQRIMKNDFKGFLKYLHNDYLGWNYTSFTPVKKSDIQNELLHLPKRKIIWYNLIPLAINVLNELAVVHYIYSVRYQGKDGVVKEKNGKNMDVLLKQKNNWLVIVDNVEILNAKSVKK